MKLFFVLVSLCTLWIQSKYIDPSLIKYSFYDCKGAQRPYYAFLTFHCSHFNGSYITASCNQTHLTTRVHSDINCQNYTETVAYGRTNCTSNGMAADCRKTPFSYGYDGQYLQVRNYGLDSTCNDTNLKTFTEFGRGRCYMEGEDSVKYISVENLFNFSPFTFYHWRYKNNRQCTGSEFETVADYNNVCFKTKRGYVEVQAASSLKINLIFIFLIVLGILIQ
jgi:hypothetical protein